MKKRALILALAAAAALCLVSCGGDMAKDMENGLNDMGQDMEQGMENAGNALDGSGADAPSGNMQNTAARYSENDVEFDIPESWRSNFLAERNEHNADTLQGYSTVDFYYTTANGDPLKIMTVGRFSKDAWGSMVQQNKEAEEKKIGESADGAWVYSLNYEAEPLSQDEAYLQVRRDAEGLREKIKITK